MTDRFRFLARAPYRPLQEGDTGWVPEAPVSAWHCRDAYEGWRCTRQLGHHGDHAAHIGPIMCAAWSQT